MDPGAPRRGRHASPDTDARGVPALWPPSAAPRPAHGRGGPEAGGHPAFPDRRASVSDRYDDPAGRAPSRAARPDEVLAGVSRGGVRRVPGMLDISAEDTGPVGMEWRHGGDLPDPRRSPGDAGSFGSGQDDGPGRHPSAPIPPLPAGAWSRLGDRPDGDDATQAQPALRPPAPPAEDPAEGAASDAHDGHPQAWDPPDWEEETGGLEVIGAHVDEEPARRGRRRGAADTDADRLGHDPYDEDLHDEDLNDEVLRGGGDLADDEIPLEPYDRRDRRDRRSRRRRRRPISVLLALVVLGALVAGVVVGGQKILGLFVAEDYTGQGTGSVDVRVQSGDTLSDIARTLVQHDVIASIGPFVDAANNEPKAMGITAGVYRLHKQMSGAAALQLLLDPASRQVSRVTIPEGLTAANTLQRIADGTGVPVAEVQAAAADPLALGLPAYANGQLEGFLFPATYDVEPGQTAVDVLKGMVARSTQALDQLGVPAEQRLTVLTKASLVQAEANTAEDMAKVARVLENRLAMGMPLQLDTTVNYANGKTGITTTPQDRENPSPYNTYKHEGLPPGPIGNPGEDAIRAVLSPAQGDWLYFVVVNPDTHDTRFAVTATEHAANVALFQQWLREHPGG